MWYLISLAFLLLINYKCVDSATESANILEEFENLKATVMAEVKVSLTKGVSKHDRKMQDLQATVSRCVELGQRQENYISPQSEQMRQPPTFIVENSCDISDDNRFEHDMLGLHHSIVTNIGNGYNNHQGVFTAPISGLYLFTTSLMSNHNMEFWLNFVVNRTIIARLNDRGTDGRHGSGSQTIILSLNKGEYVAVQNEHNNGTFWGDKYSSFGGYLIQELESETSSIIG
ncbi:uncharacterized protein LOC132723806 [Ruditapes philippinarum]|uniref:uncharacterized protein LOC132723806 n=1 Tax=Ruditapes philippinarum TaxID=129788 RepID=UPI00295A78F2|nr:uncharacterized protein LOC132723806 [Ruditapes philippinarum]